MRGGALILCAALALVGAGDSHPIRGRAEDVARAEVGRLPHLRPGDVVFISVPDALWARIAAQWSLPRYGHGHVGMVVATGAGGVIVVHAGGSPTRGEARITRTPLADFAHAAQRIDVFRPVRDEAARQAAAAADDYAAQRLGFDADFSLDTPKRLYCTEMIWRALSAGFHQDVLPVKSRLAGRAAVLPRDLETTSYLRLIGGVVAGR